MTLSQTRVHPQWELLNQRLTPREWHSLQRFIAPYSRNLKRSPRQLVSTSYGNALWKLGSLARAQKVAAELGEVELAAKLQEAIDNQTYLAAKARKMHLNNINSALKESSNDPE